MHTIRLTPLEEDTGTRLDSFLSRRVEGLTRSAAARLLAEGCVTCDGAVPGKSYRIAGGEELCVTLPEAEEPEAVPQDIPLDVVYEDEDVIVVNKPVGMVVHPAPGPPDGTLVNAQQHHCGDSLSGIGGEKRPDIVHRIDRDTSGLIIAAKNDAAHQALSAQMSVHSIHRVYHAVVYGNLKEDEGFVEKWLGRDTRDRKKMAVLAENAAGAKYAYTGWQVLERCGNFTYIACKLKTGRTHQIRVHMASIMHPLLGDELYGPKPQKMFEKLQGQTLHAKILGFQHPVTNQYIEVESPLPQYFVELLKNLGNS